MGYKVTFACGPTPVSKRLFDLSRRNRQAAIRFGDDLVDRAESLASSPEHGADAN
jgi:hypothetical protein